MRYNPVKNVDFNSLPNYAIANVPILTYALLGITTLTLGYITIKDKEAENAGSENASVESVIAPTTAIASDIQLEKGGKKLKSKKSKSKSKTRSKKHL